MAVLTGALLYSDAAKEEASKGEQFTRLFDGKTLDGWRRSNEPGHGSGCIWQVRDGAIDGVQESPGAWGILTTAAKYGDFELRLDVKTEWPAVAGILLRSSPEGHAYEVRIQSRPGGDVGGIAVSRVGELEAPAKDWLKAWKKDDWNEIRVAIRGDPPEIRTELNGSAMAEHKAASKHPRLGATGHVALKLHGDEDCFGNHVLFRNIRILETK